jgi:hypothetical protein
LKCQYSWHTGEHISISMDYWPFSHAIYYSR